MGPMWGICGHLCGVGVGPIWAGPDGDDVSYIGKYQNQGCGVDRVFIGVGVLMSTPTPTPGPTLACLD